MKQASWGFYCHILSCNKIVAGSKTKNESDLDQEAAAGFSVLKDDKGSSCNIIV